MVDIYNKLLPKETWKKNPPHVFKMLNAATNPLPKLLTSNSSGILTVKYYQNSPIGIYIRAQKLKANINDYTYGCPTKKDFQNNDRPTTMMNKVLAKILGGEIDYDRKSVTKVHLETTPFYVACAKGESNHDSTNILKGEFEISQPARIIFIPESDLLNSLIENGSQIKTTELLREYLSSNKELHFPMSEEKPLNDFPTIPKHFEKNGKRIFKIVHPAFLTIGKGIDRDCENTEAADIILDSSGNGFDEEFPHNMVGCMVRNISP